MTKQNRDQDQQVNSEPTHEEKEWTRNFEKENFGRELERDVNGDPVGEVKWRK